MNNSQMFYNDEMTYEMDHSFTLNVLQLLRRATPSTFGRSRVVIRNTKKNMERRGPGEAGVKTSTTVKTVSVQARMREFKGEPFCETNRKLFCKGCREVLAIKASIIKRHITSEKHKLGKTRLSQKEAREAIILQAIKKYDNEVPPEGKTLSDEQRVYRVTSVY